MAVINTNVQSLTAQRNLSASQSQLSTSMQRLSSGLRINSAKDDAAGLAISERMSTQIRGLNQAARNANDGVSLAQTAEGALGTIGNNLQRIRELAVQSRNATNSTDDRAALQKEVAQLKSEIDRVAGDTSFNGTKLLDGSFTEKEFQVGADQGQRISIDSIQNTKIASLGEWATAAKNTYTQTTNAITVTAATPASLSINGITISSANGTLAELEASFNTAKTANAALNNVTFDVAAGKITSTDKNLTIGSLAGVGGVTAGTTAGTATAVASTNKTGFTDLDISTEAGADDAILAMDAALKAVNSARADLGAIQNRFESVVSNLGVNSENLSASRSRIVDADFASETANLSRSQILQQAGTAMVAQANQLPQGVLALLR
ncbi:flagellin [Acidovorax carolinensis]|uniref:Flagellin n=1 Tax=Acidovorax carolinensis TaxID=553814 RepID=A0A240U6H6_9BURK|nr:flagellin [Acidovorax carolinensis]ART52993.1 flagellin [Acidovorax carolinensis]